VNAACREAAADTTRVGLAAAWPDAEPEALLLLELLPHPAASNATTAARITIRCRRGILSAPHKDDDVPRQTSRRSL
jgi:hypothetical protein